MYILNVSANPVDDKRNNLKPYIPQLYRLNGLLNDVSHGSPSCLNVSKKRPVPPKIPLRSTVERLKSFN